MNIPFRNFAAPRHNPTGVAQGAIRPERNHGRALGGVPVRRSTWAFLSAMTASLSWNRSDAQHRSSIEIWLPRRA
jgi:hypothetical protein